MVKKTKIKKPRKKQERLPGRGEIDRQRAKKWKERIQKQRGRNYPKRAGV